MDAALSGEPAHSQLTAVVAAAADVASTCISIPATLADRICQQCRSADENTASRVTHG